MKATSSPIQCNEPKIFLRRNMNVQQIFTSMEKSLWSIENGTQKANLLRMIFCLPFVMSIQIDLCSRIGIRVACSYFKLVLLHVCCDFFFFFFFFYFFSRIPSVCLYLNLKCTYLCTNDYVYFSLDSIPLPLERRQLLWWCCCCFCEHPHSHVVCVSVSQCGPFAIA